MQGVDVINAAKRLSTSVVNADQRGSTLHVNGLQQNSTAENLPLTLSSLITHLCHRIGQVSANRSSQKCSKLSVDDLESINADSPVKRKRSGGGRAFHSRLEPFVDFIREQRQRRRTWKEIATALAGEKNCSITAQGIHQFYRRQLQRHAKGHWEDEANHSKSQPARPSALANRAQSRPAPLPMSSDFKRPNLSTINTEEFT